MKKKTIIIIGAVAIISLAVSAVALSLNYKPEENKNSSDNPYSNDPYGSSKIPYNAFEPNSLDRTVNNYSVNPIWNDITKDYRPRWKGCSNEEYLNIFGNLPKMPQDFYRKYQMFMKGTLTDYDRLEPEYWKQPEFYGLEQNFFDTYITRWKNQWNIGQISCKPSFRYAELKKGATVQLSTFFHTEIIGSEAYLGAIFYSHLPENAMKQDGTIIFKQPNNAGQYIKTKIVSPSNDEIFMKESFQQNLKGKAVNINSDEKIVLFPATYKKIDEQGTKKLQGFLEKWCHKVTAQIHIKENCPPGEYIVAIDYKNPCSAINEEYNWIISGYPYYSYYFPAVREHYPVAPYFQMIITVV